MQLNEDLEDLARRMSRYTLFAHGQTVSNRFQIGSFKLSYYTCRT